MIENKPQNYDRNHSFSKKPSVAQVCSILTFVVEALIFYIEIINSLENQKVRISMICLFTFSLTGLLIFSMLTGQIDCTDQLFIASKNGQYAKVVEYRKKNQQNVKNCSLCNVSVKKNSGHCRTCQRCSQEFDHHCIWLNTCIGGKNYKYFIITLSFSFLTFSIYLIGLSLLTGEMKMNNKRFDYFGFIIAWIFSIFVVIFLILIINLALFHLYLNWIGLTTYEFIVLKTFQKPIQTKNDSSAQVILQQNFNINPDQLIDWHHQNNQVQGQQTHKDQQSKDTNKINQTDLKKNQIIDQKKQDKGESKIDIHHSDPINNINSKHKIDPHRSHGTGKGYKQFSMVNHKIITQDKIIDKSLTAQKENKLSLIDKLILNQTKLSKFFTKNPTLDIIIGTSQYEQSINQYISTVRTEINGTQINRKGPLSNVLST